MRPYKDRLYCASHRYRHDMMHSWMQDSFAVAIKQNRRPLISKKTTPQNEQPQRRAATLNQKPVSVKIT